MRDLGLGWITSPEVCDHEHACVCVDVQSTPSRPGQAHGERPHQVCVPTVHRLMCPAWCPCPRRVWRPGQRQDFALRPQHSRLGTVRALRGPRARAAALVADFRRWETQLRPAVGPRFRALTKCFLLRPAEAVQGARPPWRICPSQGARAQDFPGLKAMTPELTGADGQACVGKACTQATGNNRTWSPENPAPGVRRSRVYSGCRQGPGRAHGHARGPTLGGDPGRGSGRELRPESPLWIQRALCS